MNCACGNPVKYIRKEICGRCYRKKYRAEKKALYPNSSLVCRDSRHNECSGERRSEGSEFVSRRQCECFCHTHVCPRCKQPTDRLTKSRLLNASLKLQQVAKELTNGVSQ